jgi:hypothetical protein
MRLTDLQAQIPGLAEARTREHLNRALAFAHLASPILGQEVVLLTPRHRLELQLAGNAFCRDFQPRKGDVFQLLWRLSPSFRARLNTPRAVWAYWRLKRTMKGIPEPIAVRAANDYLVDMLQDLPEDSDGGSVNGNGPENYLHWMAVESYFYMTTMGISFSGYCETPYLVLQQWHRTFRLTREANPSFINQSDRLAARWFRTVQPRN